MRLPHPLWVYEAGATHVDELKPIARDVESNVEFWTGIMKQLGRDADDFCRDAMKEAKRESKALAWLRRYWAGDCRADTMPAELSFLIERLAWRVIMAREAS